MKKTDSMTAGPALVAGVYSQSPTKTPVKHRPTEMATQVLRRAIGSIRGSHVHVPTAPVETMRCFATVAASSVSGGGCGGSSWAADGHERFDSSVGTGAATPRSYTTTAMASEKEHKTREERILEKVRPNPHAVHGHSRHPQSTPPTTHHPPPTTHHPPLPERATSTR